MDIFLDVDNLHECGCLADEVGVGRGPPLPLIDQLVINEHRSRHRTWCFSSSRAAISPPRRAPSSTRRRSDWESRSFSSMRRMRTRAGPSSVAGENRGDTTATACRGCNRGAAAAAGEGGLPRGDPRRNLRRSRYRVVAALQRLPAGRTQADRRRRARHMRLRPPAR